MSKKIHVWISATLHQNKCLIPYSMNFLNPTYLEGYVHASCIHFSPFSSRVVIEFFKFLK